MARTIKPVDLSTRTARARLTPQEEPRWNSLVSGKIHLGYLRRSTDGRVGKWILRTRRAGRYSYLRLATADEVLASDGIGTLTFDEARERALELAGGERVVGSPTVGRAFEDYVRNLRERGKTTEVARTASIYLAGIADVRLDELTTEMLQSWLASVAAVSVRHGKPVVGAEAVRRRRNSANRIATALIAALNLARKRKRVSSDAAWRDLEKFEGVDVPRSGYLSIDESIRLLNACDPDLRDLVRAALETGCRFGELSRLTVANFNPDVGVVAVWTSSKTKRSRHVVLTDQGAAFFAQICAGRRGDELMFARADGGAWRHTNVARPMDAAVARAKISPRISFHNLRHSYASLSIMGRVPLMVVARNLGHTTTRMVEKHYGHLAEGYIADEIRRGAPRYARLVPGRGRRSLGIRDRSLGVEIGSRAV